MRISTGSILGRRSGDYPSFGEFCFFERHTPMHARAHRRALEITALAEPKRRKVARFSAGLIVGFCLLQIPYPAVGGDNTNGVANNSAKKPSPVISAISTAPSNTSATVTWTTDQPSSSTVNYGLTSAYGSSVSNPALVTAHSSSLVNLTCNTTYHFQVSSTNSSGQTARSGDRVFTTTACPLAISAVNVVPSSTSATVTWTTNQPSSSTVNYGLTSAYGSSVSNPALVTSHSSSLVNLTCNTTYHFQVSSTNSNGQTATSGDQVFTTTACPLAISAVNVVPSSTSATVNWTTNVAADSRVDYGLTASYNLTNSDASLVTTHSLSLTGLTCNTQYHYKITSVDGSANSANTADSTFLTTTCGTAGPVSDDFHSTALNTSLWTFVNPRSDSTLTMNGTNAVIAVPGGVNHELWTNTITAPRLMQTIGNGDFQVEAKFDLGLVFQTHGSQEEGFMVEQDTQKFIRFALLSSSSSSYVYVATFAAGQPTTVTYVAIPLTNGQVPVWMRVQRAGNNWTMSWSVDGNAYTTSSTFSYTLTVSQIGPYAANAGDASASAPAFTASIDYFFNTASPISPEDGGVDITPTSVSVSPGLAGATVSWSTADWSSSRVDYGTTNTYGTNVTNAALVTSHSLNITGLDCGVTYHYQVTSADSTGSSKSSPDATFSTNSCGTGSGPTISNVIVTPAATFATVAWTTDQPSSSTVNYGLTSAYGNTVSNPALVTSHSSSLTNLTCNTTYHFQVSSANGNGQASTPDKTFATGNCAVVSDNFDSTTLNTALWTFVNPAGDAVLTMNGTAATINVPQGSNHDPWTSGNGAVQLMQQVPNSDFQVQVRFQSFVEIANQDQGIMVVQDAADFLRFDLLNDGTNVRIFAAGIKGSSATVFANININVRQAPIWLQLQRTGNNWVAEWSNDGVNYSTAGSFNFALTVSSLGPYAGTSNPTPANSPAFTAIVDYFFNMASPVANQDGPPPFTAITVDPNPPSTLVEKALADIQGTGHLNPVAGFESPSGGIYWYEYPASGVLTDPWIKHPVVSDGNAYEDMVPLDVNGDGAVDIIASYSPPGGGNCASSGSQCLLVWFENPRGHGGNPATDTWNMHLIGTGVGENNLVLADLDGDGRLDIASGTYIYFQNSADSWTQVQYNNAFRGVATLDIGSGKGKINLVGTSSTNSTTYNAAWFENPRETGGNARTGTWIMHTIGPGYTCTNTNCPGGDFFVATYATGDLNGDQRMDVVMGQSEGPFGVAPPPGGLIWFEAPVDRRNGTWARQTIDANYTHTHAIRVVDMDKNGTLDLVTSEQDQSRFRRVSVFYNNGLGNFTQEIVSNAAGHQTCVGDVTGSGAIDIFNSGHGYMGMIHPLQIFLNPVQ